MKQRAVSPFAVVAMLGLGGLLAGCQHQQDAGVVMLQTLSNAMHSASMVGLMGGISNGNVKMAAAGLGAAAVSAAAQRQADRLIDQQQLKGQGLPARSSGGAGGAPSAGPVVGTRDGLPDTPACRRYLRYLKRAGMPGTMEKAVRHYQACLASAPDHPTSRRLQCAPGKYVYYLRGRWHCDTDAARQWDIEASAYNARLLFR